MLYFVMIHSKISISHLHLGLFKYDLILQPIQILQKEALKYVWSVNMRFPIQDWFSYQEFKVLIINNLNKLAIGKFHKVVSTSIRLCKVANVLFETITGQVNCQYSIVEPANDCVTAQPFIRRRRCHKSIDLKLYLSRLTIRQSVTPPGRDIQN